MSCTKRCSTLLSLAAVIACAQTNSLPIKNWPSPLWWQPSSAEDKNHDPTNPTSYSRRQAVADSSAAAQPQAGTSASQFVSMTPCRIMDTRGYGQSGVFGTPSLAAGVARAIPITTHPVCAVPPGAAAYSLNFTVVPKPTLTYLSAWQDLVAWPGTSVLNAPLPGSIVANSAVVPAGSNDGIQVLASDPTDLIIDINGYYVTANIGLQSLSGVAQGTAAAPTISFANDLGTGIFSSGTGALNIATGGVNRLTVRADGDLDLAGNIRRGGALFLSSLVSPSNLGVGANALANATTAGGSTAVQNTGVGTGALFSLTTGYNNVAVGTNAGSKIVTNGDLVAVGSGVLGNSTAGANTGVGSFALASNTTGAMNTAAGYLALNKNTDGGYNVAVGRGALFLNNHGSYQTGVGAFALQNSDSAGVNTAVGYFALNANKGGQGNVAVGGNAIAGADANYNTAVGQSALAAQAKDQNTAVGFQALKATTATTNTAVGYNAMVATTVGYDNVAVGTEALVNNIDGKVNTALGRSAAFHNTSGADNTAVGINALFSNATSTSNVAVGSYAGFNATGGNNVFVGKNAGYAVQSGNNNIHIGNGGAAADDSVIRLGSGQTQTFIAGINGTGVGATGTLVFVNSNGQLGTLMSSARFKQDIRDMGDSSDPIHRLRPVTFRYKEQAARGEQTPEYGLIAEEVAKVFPDLAIYDNEGKPVSVRYHELNTLLLNELQKQDKKIEALTAEIEVLKNLMLQDRR